MAQDEIPNDIEAFIDTVVDSVATMEALALTYRGRDKSWSAAEVAQRLYVSETRARESLERLAAHGGVREDAGRYHYEPQGAELEALLARVVQTYDRQLIAVTNRIHARVRPSITEFANAFRMRKDK
jgi:DNA-binding IclR family transcriptional regulator